MSQGHQASQRPAAGVRVRGCRRRALWLTAAWLVLAGATGCPEWLEVDTPRAQPDAESAASLGGGPTHAAVLPNVPPRASAKGPIVPRTSGLRVPDGYWTRVRLDQADLLLPHTWGLLQPAGYAEGGEPRGMVFRLQAVGESDSANGAPTLRGVIRIATPPGTKPEQLLGLSFGPDALVDSTVSLRISRGTLWNVAPERLSIDALDAHVVKGTLEGRARAGKRAKRSRTFRAAFVALRGDKADAASVPGNQANP
jgi:hypothetical protein